MSKKNQETQTSEVTIEKEEKAQMTQEHKDELIQKLRKMHKEAIATKDTAAQKKIRRNLRKHGVYLSKEKASAIEAMIQA